MKIYDITMIGLTLSDGERINLKPTSVKNYRGIRLPGAQLYQNENKKLNISIHNFTSRLFNLSLRNLNCYEDAPIAFSETNDYLRIESVINGQGSIVNSDNSETVLLPGQYHIANERNYKLHFTSLQSFIYLIIYISPELMKQIPLSESIGASTPRMMTPIMRDILTRMLENPFEEKLRDALYDYSIRELLFYHVSAPKYNLPGELSNEEISAVYAADAIIAVDINVHHTIPELARMAHTNSFVLKTGFPKIFGMTVFDRLLQRKMEMAKYLLENTNKQIQEISELSGYETTTGFINAFKREFKISPREWRKKSRGYL